YISSFKSSSDTLPHNTLYTQAVYISTIGKKIAVAINITHSVLWLDDASHTVKLCAGWLLLGRIIGNIVKPTVAMMLATARLEPIKLSAPRPVARATEASNVPASPATGASHNSG